jgi:hypothetical protein
MGLQTRATGNLFREIRATCSKNTLEKAIAGRDRGGRKICLRGGVIVRSAIVVDLFDYQLEKLRISRLSLERFDQRDDACPKAPFGCLLCLSQVFREGARDIADERVQSIVKGFNHFPASIIGSAPTGTSRGIPFADAIQAFCRSVLCLTAQGSWPIASLNFI